MPEEINQNNNFQEIMKSFSNMPTPNNSEGNAAIEFVKEIIQISQDFIMGTMQREDYLQVQINRRIFEIITEMKQLEKISMHHTTRYWKKRKLQNIIQNFMMNKWHLRGNYNLMQNLKFKNLKLRASWGKKKYERRRFI